MPAQVKDAWGRFTGTAGQLSLAQRTFALIGIAALVLGVVAFSSWASRPTLVPLFSGLSGTDASAVVDELTSAGVAYQLGDGGSTVLVPAAAVYEQRVRLAAAGLPADSDGTGYSLLDEMPMTASEFQQETTYRRALEGELSRTVGAIDGVQTATVRLAIPEETVFVAATSDPTASVFVRTRPGAELTADQVQAVTHLVSAGVDGMEPSDVAVVDASGRVLSAVGTTTAGGALTDSRAADYEGRVGGAVQTMLDRLVGPGNAAVTVNAQLDLSESERTTEEFSATPDTPPLGSSTTTEEYTGTAAAGSAAGGVLGPDNIAVPDTGAGTGTYSSTSEEVTNAVNKSTEVTRSAPGTLQRQSVSVLVDQGAAGPLDMADLTAAVAAAAGIDEARGDTLSVQRMAFDTTTAQAAQEALAAADAQAQEEAQAALIREVAVVAGVVLLVVIVLAVLARRSRRARREALDLGELTAAQQAAVTLASIETLPEDDLPVLPPAPPAVDPTAVRRAEIVALADEQPEQVAELLRGWMSTGARR